MKKKMLTMMFCMSVSMMAVGCGSKEDAKSTETTAAVVENESVALAEVADPVNEEALAEDVSGTDVTEESFEVAFERGRFEVSMELLHMPTFAIEEKYGITVDENVTGQLYGSSDEYAQGYIESEDVHIFVVPGDTNASPVYVQFGHDAEVEFCKELFFSPELSYDELADQLAAYEFVKGEVTVTEDQEYVCHFTNSSMDIMCISSEENGSDFYFYIGLPQ